MIAARKAAVLALLVAAGSLWMGGIGAGPALGVELCSRRAGTLMRSVGIKEGQIRQLCEKLRRSEALLTLEVVRRKNQIGYCRITLGLRNNSTETVEALVLSSEDSLFELFHFANVLPGGMAYASANSRILMACGELEQVKMVFHWPAGMRIGGRTPGGSQVERFKPLLLDSALAWKQ